MAVNQVQNSNMPAAYRGGDAPNSPQQADMSTTEQTNGTSREAYQVDLSEAARAQTTREMETRENRQEEQTENAAAERETMRRAEAQRQAQTQTQTQGNTYNAGGEIA